MCRLKDSTKAGHFLDHRRIDLIAVCMAYKVPECHKPLEIRSGFFADDHPIFSFLQQNGMPISSARNLRAQALQHEYNDFFYTVVNGREGKRGGPDFNVVQRLIFLLYSGSILTKSNSRFTCSNSPSTAGTGRGLSDSFDIGAGEDLAAEDFL